MAKPTVLRDIVHMLDICQRLIQDNSADMLKYLIEMARTEADDQFRQAISATSNNTETEKHDQRLDIN